MTKGIAVSQRARECLAKEFDGDSYAGTAINIRRGTLVGIPAERAIKAMVRFEAEIRADEREKPARMKAAELESAIAAAIRNQKDHDHE